MNPLQPRKEALHFFLVLKALNHMCLLRCKDFEGSNPLSIFVSLGTRASALPLGGGKFKAVAPGILVKFVTIS